MIEPIKYQNNWKTDLHFRKQSIIKSQSQQSQLAKTLQHTLEQQPA